MNRVVGFAAFQAHYEDENHLEEVAHQLVRHGAGVIQAKGIYLADVGVILAAPQGFHHVSPQPFFLVLHRFGVELYAVVAVAVGVELDGGSHRQGGGERLPDVGREGADLLLDLQHLVQPEVLAEGVLVGHVDAELPHSLGAVAALVVEVPPAAVNGPAPVGGGQWRTLERQVFLVAVKGGQRSDPRQLRQGFIQRGQFLGGELQLLGVNFPGFFGNAAGGQFPGRQEAAVLLFPYHDRSHQLAGHVGQVALAPQRGNFAEPVALLLHPVVLNYGKQFLRVFRRQGAPLRGAPGGERRVFRGVSGRGRGCGVG